MVEITVDMVLQMAKAADLVIPEEDLEEVRSALSDYRMAFRPVEALDLTDVDPALIMDPRWVR
jgi:Asp-tRNA(Asn)/Glu-tRNA(Gln) amidotransferase C subunit